MGRHQCCMSDRGSESLGARPAWGPIVRFLFRFRPQPEPQQPRALILIPAPAPWWVAFLFPRHPCLACHPCLSFSGLLEGALEVDWLAEPRDLNPGQKGGGRMHRWNTAQAKKSLPGWTGMGVPGPGPGLLVWPGLSFVTPRLAHVCIAPGTQRLGCIYGGCPGHQQDHSLLSLRSSRLCTFVSSWA